MKTPRLYLLASVAALAFSAPAFAEGTSIATVNYQMLMSSSSAAKSAHEQIDSKSKSMQSEISKKAEQFQKDSQELEKQRSVMAKDAFEEKKRAFAEKVTSAQKEVQSKRAILDSASEHAGNELHKTISEIVTEMAKEKGFTLVIPSSQILYGDSKLDITNEVMEKLNKKLPKVDIKFEAKK